MFRLSEVMIIEARQDKERKMLEDSLSFTFMVRLSEMMIIEARQDKGRKMLEDYLGSRKFTRVGGRLKMNREKIVDTLKFNSYLFV